VGDAAAGPGLSVALLAAIGFFGASYPMVMAHGRAFLSAASGGAGGHAAEPVRDRGGGAGAMGDGRSMPRRRVTPPEAPYAAIFLFFAGMVAVGLAVYLFSRDRTD
jgi:hypothetical protein